MAEDEIRLTQLRRMLSEAFRYEPKVIGQIMSILGFTYFFVGLIPSFLGKWVRLEWFVFIGFALVATSCFLSQFVTIQSPPRQLITICRASFPAACGLWIKAPT